MFNPIPLVKSELKRTRMGAVAIVLLIATATGLGIAVSSQDKALRKGSTLAAHDFDLLIGAPGSPTQLVLSTVYLQPSNLSLLPGSVVTDLQQERGVDFAAPIALGDHYGPYPIVGTTRDFLTLGGRRPLKEGRIFQSVREAVVGAAVALSMAERFTPAHGSIPEASRKVQERDEPGDHEAGHSGVTYTIVGRLPRQGTPWDRAILVPVESVWEVHGLPMGHPAGSSRIGPPWSGETPGVPAIVVKPKTFSDAYDLRNRYRRGNVTAIFPAEVLLRLYDLMGNLRDVMAGMSLMTDLLVLASILISIFILLNNRRRQLAVLRAMGATPGYLFTSVWLYAAFLVTTGALLGLAFGWCAAHLLSAGFSAKIGLHLPVSITRDELLLTGGFALVSVLVALVPAWMSYRLPVAASLKSHE
jgi:putative ABC transport system permease protein